MAYPPHYVARVLDTARAAHGNTQAAIDAAAASLGLPAHDVARRATEHAHAVALAENRLRDDVAAGGSRKAKAIAYVAANGALGARAVAHDDSKCAGCGACTNNCGRREPEAVPY